MATISFFAGNSTLIDTAGSGLGFYGASFGASVAVGSYQNTTFITNSLGTTQGQQCHNLTWANAQSGIVDSSTSGINIRNIPNYQCPLNIRFTHATPVKVQNAKWRLYDRSSINNNPSGVTAKCFQAVHPDTSQATTGSGDSTWTTPGGSSIVMSLTSSPGASGEYINGTNTSGTQHDWYLGISASPDTVGSKLFAGYFSLEYL